jgi:hypothetical protein
VWALHEAEEWFILSWYERYWTNLQGLSSATVRTWLVFSSVTAFVATFLLTRIRRIQIASGLVLLFFVPLLFPNAVQHVFWVFYFGAYAPGVVTAVALLVPAVLYLAIRSVREARLPIWIVAALHLPTVPVMVITLRLGNEAPPGGLWFYRFSSRLYALLVGLG